jgi:hypothetical protein
VNIHLVKISFKGRVTTEFLVMREGEKTATKAIRDERQWIREATGVDILPSGSTMTVESIPFNQRGICEIAICR